MRLWSNNSVPRGNGGFNPEKRLLSAVLQRAITDFLTGEGELQSSAKEWMFCQDDTSETFGFAYICEALDLHVEELRKVMTRQYEQQHSKPLQFDDVEEVAHVRANANRRNGAVYGSVAA